MGLARTFSMAVAPRGCLAAALAVFAWGSAAAGGPASSGGSATSAFTVTIACTESMKQSMLAAHIRVRNADGTVIELTPEQRARYLEDPATVWKTIGTEGARRVTVEVEF